MIKKYIPKVYLRETKDPKEMNGRELWDFLKLDDTEVILKKQIASYSRSVYEFIRSNEGENDFDFTFVIPTKFFINVMVHESYFTADDSVRTMSPIEIVKYCNSNQKIMTNAFGNWIMDLIDDDVNFQKAFKELKINAFLGHKITCILKGQEVQLSVEIVLK